jgi:hypothetical protein
MIHHPQLTQAGTVPLMPSLRDYLQTAVVPMMLQLYDRPRVTGENFAGIPPLKYRVQTPPGTLPKVATPPLNEFRFR